MNNNINLDTWTMMDIVKWGTEYFQNKGIDSPRLTIELLLCKLLSIQRIEIYTNFERPMMPGELKSLKKMIKRRIGHEPLQYILGSVNFLGIELSVNQSVLIPRPETELLVEIVKNDISKNTTIEALDIGTGSGCISIALANHFENIQIDAIDISAESLGIAKSNAEKLGLSNIQFKEMDIFSKDNDKQYNLIVSNPPYISENEYNSLAPEIANFEPRTALSDNSDGLDFYRHFAFIFNNILKDDGSFYLEIGAGQKESVYSIFKDHAFELDFIDDLNGIPRVAKYFKK